MVCREILTSIIEVEGYNITSVEAICQVVRLVNKKCFDLVIADIDLSVYFANKALPSAIKEMKGNYTKLLLITGYKTMQLSIKTLMIEIDSYIYKSVSKKVFICAIEKTLQMQSLEHKVDYYRDLCIFDDLTDLYNRKYFDAVRVLFQAKDFGKNCLYNWNCSASEKLN